jgi:hypothetical protein
VEEDLHGGGGTAGHPFLQGSGEPQSLIRQDRAKENNTVLAGRVSFESNCWKINFFNENIDNKAENNFKTTSTSV